MPSAHGRTHSIRWTARAAGVLCLVIFIVAPLAYLVARSSILVEDDPAATAQNLIDNERRFRLGLVAESVVFLVEIVLAALLYVILRPVSRTISLAAAFSRVAEAVAQAANLLPASLALLAVGGAGYFATSDQEQRNNLVLLALDANEFMVLVVGSLLRPSPRANRIPRVPMGILPGASRRPVGTRVPRLLRRELRDHPLPRRERRARNRGRRTCGPRRAGLRPLAPHQRRRRREVERTGARGGAAVFAGTRIRQPGHAPATSGPGIRSPARLNRRTAGREDAGQHGMRRVRDGSSAGAVALSVYLRWGPVATAVAPAPRALRARPSASGSSAYSAIVAGCIRERLALLDETAGNAQLSASGSRRKSVESAGRPTCGDWRLQAALSGCFRCRMSAGQKEACGRSSPD